MLRTWGRRSGWVVGVGILAAAAGLLEAGPAMAQDPRLIVRPGPAELDDLETDANKDGIPDGWYNNRDVSWEAKGGAIGPHFLRFHASEPDRPARISRGFGVDGSKYEAIVLGLWVRQHDVQLGERNGAEPSLLIMFYREATRPATRNVLGPWTHTVGERWTRVVKRIAVPPDAKEAILSTGLLGATGTFDVDGLTVQLVPKGGVETTNLIVNGDFELGDPAPAHWIVKDARRVFPGSDSQAGLELTHNRAFAMAPVALPVDRFTGLDLSITARCTGLRGAGGAMATFYFVDRHGRDIEPPGQQIGAPLLNWAGTTGWDVQSVQVAVPPGAVRAVLQIAKLDGIGSIKIDDVHVTAAPDAQAGAWTPFHVADDTDDWLEVAPSPQIAAGGALDVSFLIPKSSGQSRGVSVKEGRLAFTNGGRARFLGVSLMETTAFLDAERADGLADRLARSGINLVRLGGLDMPLGPGRSLIDDTRDDTQAFDPEVLARLEHLIAALESRGIYVALEFRSGRRFRSGDRVAAAGLLPGGGGPAASFDPTIGKLALKYARDLLEHVNPETGLALREDPALAWVTLAGEVSLFDLIENPQSLPAAYITARPCHGPGRPEWSSSLEMGRGRALPSDGRRPASREAACADRRHLPLAAGGRVLPSPGDKGARPDRRPALLAAVPRVDVTEVRSMLWSREGGSSGTPGRSGGPTGRSWSASGATSTFGAWSEPTEAADYLLGVYTAGMEDWDALVRRGVFAYPVTWGEGPGGDDRRRRPLPVARGHERQPARLRLVPARRVAVPPGRSGARWRPRGTRHAAQRWRCPAGTRRTAGSSSTRRSPRRWLAGPGEPLRGSSTSSSRAIMTSPCWPPPRSAPSRSPRRSGCWSPRSPGSSRPGSSGSIAGSSRWPTRAVPRSSRSPCGRARVASPGDDSGFRRRQCRRAGRPGHPGTAPGRRRRRPGHRRPDRRLPLGAGRRVNHRMRTIVTGGAGFIGSHLVDRLLADGAEVVVVDSFDPFYPRGDKEANLAAALAQPRCRLVEVDIRDAEGVAALVANVRPDAIVHLAARAGVRPSIADPRLYADVNVLGTINWLEAASRLDPLPRFVYASSSSVYGDRDDPPFRETDPVNRPVSPYAATKRSCELMAQTFHHLRGLPVTGLRFFTAYGPRNRPDLAIAKFVGLIDRGEPVPMFGDGSTRRDYTYIDDIVDGISRAIERVRRRPSITSGEPIRSPCAR